MLVLKTIPAILLLLAVVACQQPAETVATNTTSTNSTANPVTTPTPVTTLVAEPGAVINTREPEKYRAVFVVSAQTAGGERAIAIPEISAEVARNGADRRIAFKLPSNETIVYVDRADKRFVISPTRKQYAELSAQATGFEIQRMMTPGQLVSFLEKQRGYERVGEEQVNGRTAEKYRFAGKAQTGTEAGDVRAETFVFVDKETGLPLRSELYSEATGSVQGGVKGIKVVAEMRDIQLDVDPGLFDVPQGYQQVSPEQVRQQVDVLIRALTAVAGSLISNMSGTPSQTGTTMSPSPSATASPSPTARQ